MAEQQYLDSPYRFTDPVRLFKANDPYYFEVDNIPIKQLQENCLWLKDQLRQEIKIKLSSVKRADIDELRPYANGGDRVIRVNPGRYTARINDASTRVPLAYLQKIMGEVAGDVDAWEAALPNPGTFPNNKNSALQAALDKFKTAVSTTALGMNGLAERAFTWPVLDTDTPISVSGVIIDGTSSYLKYGDQDANPLGANASLAPFVISEALVWAKSQDSDIDRVLLPTFETTDETLGFSQLPRTENFFIKAWRGISRLAIVDVDEEITVEVPAFDANDFSYTNEAGSTVPVTGVQQRIDLVFIYSKPVDASSVNILTPTGKQQITKPVLGIVRGAGIKANFLESATPQKDYITPTNNSILAAPGDQFNDSMGFNAASGDVQYDIKGSFPSPDDLLNLAPLISEKLQDSAYELIGQSILPVAYVFVSNDSPVVLSTDVVDIRPFFRTAELTYNERAGLAAALPQLSLANPAVGKAQLDYELKKVADDLTRRLSIVQIPDTQKGMNTLATGYVFGGWNFGPEGALYNYYQKVFATYGDDNDSPQFIKDYVVSEFGIGGGGVTINVPDYPDWDLARWCIQSEFQDKGLYPNDYINVFLAPDSSLAEAGSSRDKVNVDGTVDGTTLPNAINQYADSDPDTFPVTGIFHFVSKKIKFSRPTWMADYMVDISFVNCLPKSSMGNDQYAASYFGHWIEKSFDEFIIYIAFYAPERNVEFDPTQKLPVPGESFYTVYTPGSKKKKWISGKKKKTAAKSEVFTVSQRDGERFSSFLVPVEDILYAKATTPVDDPAGMVGNARAAICTYPTIMWKLTGVPVADKDFLYGNLNGTNPEISLKEN